MWKTFPRAKHPVSIPTTVLPHLWQYPGDKKYVGRGGWRKRRGKEYREQWKEGRKEGGRQGGRKAGRDGGGKRVGEGGREGREGRRERRQISNRQERWMDRCDVLKGWEQEKGVGK